MNDDLLKDLLDKYLTGSMSDPERMELLEFMGESDGETRVKEILGTEFQNRRFEGERHELIMKQIEAHVLSRVSKSKNKRVLFITGRAAAAASLILIFGSYFYHVSNKTKKIEQAIALTTNDIAPGTNKAVLTLSNGSKIILDSAKNGSLAQQGNIDVIKYDSGRLTYEGRGEKTKEIVFNTLSTPRGGKFQITLPDGSNVWLNAASSITYPTTFAGKERKVTITGEAYFEVIHNTKQPFIVEVNGTEVMDLGTLFNINAYADESSMKVTLIQGAVKISTAAYSRRLVPNEQAILQNGKLIVEKNIDTEKVIAWKNGWFELDNTTLDQLMRQLSRWYDIDVRYDGTIPAIEFGGRISNKLPLSKLLHSLEANGSGIKFSLNGKILIIHS